MRSKVCKERKNLFMHNKVHVFDQLHLRCSYRNRGTTSHFYSYSVQMYTVTHTALSDHWSKCCVYCKSGGGGVSVSHALLSALIFHWLQASSWGRQVSFKAYHIQASQLQIILYALSLFGCAGFGFVEGDESSGPDRYGDDDTPQCLKRKQQKVETSYEITITSSNYFRLDPCSHKVTWPLQPASLNNNPICFKRQDWSTNKDPTWGSIV